MVPRKNNIWSCVLQYATRNNAVLCLTTDKNTHNPSLAAPDSLQRQKGFTRPHAWAGNKIRPVGVYSGK